MCRGIDFCAAFRALRSRYSLDAVCYCQPEDFKGYTKQTTVCNNSLDYSFMPARFVCRIGYPVDYTPEALVEENCFNPTELGSVDKGAAGGGESAPRRHPSELVLGVVVLNHSETPNPRSLPAKVTNFRGNRKGSSEYGLPKCIGFLWTGTDVITGSSSTTWPTSLEKLKVEDSGETLRLWTRNRRSERFTAPEQGFLDNHIQGLVARYQDLSARMG